MERATVVTAYYPIPSKFPPVAYESWIRGFWPLTTCPLVFFTDPALVSRMEAFLRPRRGPSRVIGVRFADLAAYKYFSHGFWQDQRLLDPEGAIHSAELYAIWFEKKEFVRRAIELNPFQSDAFVWADAGICRYASWIPEFAATFPCADRIPAGRMLQLQMEAFREEDAVTGKDGIQGDMTGRICLGGGILASDRAGWGAWSSAYDAMVRRYLAAGRFIGKDQNLMASVALSQPGLVKLVRAPEHFSKGGVLSGIARWFYLLFWLAGLDS